MYIISLKCRWIRQESKIYFWIVAFIIIFVLRNVDNKNVTIRIDVFTEIYKTEVAENKKATIDRRILMSVHRQKYVHTVAIILDLLRNSTNLKFVMYSALTSCSKFAKVHWNLRSTIHWLRSSLMNVALMYVNN